MRKVLNLVFSILQGPVDFNQLNILSVLSHHIKEDKSFNEEKYRETRISVQNYYTSLINSKSGGSAVAAMVPLTWRVFGKASTKKSCKTGESSKAKRWEMAIKNR